MNKMKQHQLRPFGVEIQATTADHNLTALDTDELQHAIANHRLCVLRGFQTLRTPEILSFCRRLGKIRQWKFGEVVDLKVRNDTKNYLYSNNEVPFHWDGAFTSSAPHYIFLSCVDAPESGTGGETIFCDAGLLVANATEQQRNRWKQISITYTPDGPDSYTSSLISDHPVTGIPVLRYAEPIHGMNPMKLTIHGVAKDEIDIFLREMHTLLYNPDTWYVQSWKAGDVLIADNHALLHARRAFFPHQSRHLMKVNIL